MFGFTQSNDVKNFKYKEDVFIDAAWWMGFECEDSTVHRIITHLELTEDRNGNRRGYATFGYYPEWWDTSIIYRSRQYSWELSNVKWFLWYDVNTKKVFFLKYTI